MKVLLIRPPRQHIIQSNVPSWVDTETGLYPPLGLMYVASAVAERTDWDVAILDAEAEGLDDGGIEERVHQARPDVVGVQTLTFTLLDARRTVEAAKRGHPQTHVCLGGPHAHLYPRETLAIEGVDSAVLGEGETAFPALLEQLARTGAPEAAPGVAFRRNGETVLTPPELIEDLDSLPTPRRTMLPWRKYYSVLAKTQPITTMMTSRGCPFRCLFCDRPHLGKRFRFRSAESVVAEMSSCVELGIGEIFLYDDTFSVNRERVVEVCDAILSSKLDARWDIRARVDTLDKSLLEKLRQAGCARIHFGVESGDEQILEVLRKGIRLDQARSVFRAAREVGITTLAYFMIGNPTETRAQIETTLRFAREINPDYVHLSVTTPFPGTDLYRMGLEQGLYERDYWRDFANDPKPDFTPPVWTEAFSREELIAMLNAGYRRFYMRPGYVARRLLAVRSIGELARKARVGLRMAFSKEQNAGD